MTAQKGTSMHPNTPQVIEIKHDIPHVWDVDNCALGVRHRITLINPDTIEVVDCGLTESGEETKPHIRHIKLIQAVHVLLNASPEELDTIEKRIPNE